MKNVTVVVPIKRLHRAKSRLHPWLSPAERRSLALEMLQGVLAAAAGSRAGEILVITPDPEAGRLAEKTGAIVLPDPEPELNASLRRAFERCWRLDFTAAYVPADLPEIRARDLDALLEAWGGEETVVLTPSHDGRGTNAMVLPPETRLYPRLGENSFERHLLEAHSLGYRTKVFRNAALALDVDTPEDLRSIRTEARTRV